MLVAHRLIHHISSCYATHTHTHTHIHAHTLLLFVTDSLTPSFTHSHSHSHSDTPTHMYPHSSTSRRHTVPDRVNDMQVVISTYRCQSFTPKDTNGDANNRRLHQQKAQKGSGGTGGEEHGVPQNLFAVCVALTPLTPHLPVLQSLLLGRW